MSFGIRKILIGTIDKDITFLERCQFAKQLHDLEDQNIDNVDFMKEYMECYPDVFGEISEDTDIILLYLERSERLCFKEKKFWLEHPKYKSVIIKRFPLMEQYIKK